MSPALAASAVLLAFAALHELAGGEALVRIRRRARRGLPADLAIVGAGGIADRLALAARLERAGLERRISVQGFLLLKLAGAAASGLVAVAALPAAPGRFAPPLALGLLAAGFMAPDALVERIARRRRADVIGALPDALDLLAVGVAAGRSPLATLRDIARIGTQPLASELAIAIAEVDCGASLERGLERLLARVPGAELASLAAALERSRRHGSPLADQLHTQAAALRRDARRRVSEHAARAAPKIQLVVALVLVPSVLLVIAAALFSHSEVLLGGLGR